MTVATIDVRDLVGKPGASRELPVTGTLEGLAAELARVPDDAPIRGELLLESVVEGILVSGTLEGTMTLRCARCLTEFEQPFRVEVHELFTERPDDEGDGYPLDPDHGIDPDQMFRDTIGVELPFSPLCRPDCQGLCEICGGNRNLGECPGHEQIDPRFAVLSELLPELDAIEGRDVDGPTTDPPAGSHADPHADPHGRN